MTCFEMQETNERVNKKEKESVHKRADHGTALGNPLQISAQRYITEEA